MIRPLHFPEHEIRLFAEKANDTATIFICADFKETLLVHTEPGFVIYCDPPYLPASETANFTQYHTSSFTSDHHRELVELLWGVHRETAAPVVISNSDTPATREIYQHYQFHEISVSRSLGASAASRKKAGEVIGVLNKVRHSREYYRRAKISAKFRKETAAIRNQAFDDGMPF